MDHNVILLAVDLEDVLSPIGRDLGGRIDQYVPILKLPLSLSRTISASVNDFPTRWWIDNEFHRIRFMVHHVHEDRATVIVSMTLIELRKSSGEIVRKNFIREGQRRTALRFNTPRLIVNSSNWPRRDFALRPGRANS